MGSHSKLLTGKRCVFKSVKRQLWLLSKGRDCKRAKVVPGRLVRITAVIQARDRWASLRI